MEITKRETWGKNNQIKPGQTWPEIGMPKKISTRIRALNWKLNCFVRKSWWLARFARKRLSLHARYINFKMTSWSLLRQFWVKFWLECTPTYDLIHALDLPGDFWSSWNWFAICFSYDCLRLELSLVKLYGRSLVHVI